MPMTSPIQRRLLSHKEVAIKLGYSVDRLYRILPDLIADGFPPAVLGTLKGQGKKWDERAIDLWLDSKIPPALQERDTGTKANALDMAAIETRLASRLDAIGL